MKMQGQNPAGRMVLLAAGVTAVLFYFLAFSRIDSLYIANDRIASADSASFLALLQAPGIRTSMGDEYAIPRTPEAQNQEHKIKHILLPVLLRPVFAVGTALGIAPETMMRAIGAVLGGISIGILVWLLYQAGLATIQVIPLAAMGIFASSMFVYHGVMESWVLTGTLNLLLVLLHVKFPRNQMLVPVMAGVAMLCNVTALFFSLLVPLRVWQQKPDLARTAISGIRSAGVAAGTFFAGLTLLAVLVEPDLRIDRYVQFMAFFSSFMGEPDTWTLMSALDGATQLLLVSFVSLQPGLDLGPAGVWLTKSHSAAGTAALLVLACFWVVVAWGLVRGLIRHAGEEALQLAVRLLLVVAGTAIFLFAGHYRSMFLYASALVPCMLLVAGIALRDAGPLAQPVCWAAALTVTLTAFAQLMLLRGLLSGTSLP